MNIFVSISRRTMKRTGGSTIAIIRRQYQLSTLPQMGTEFERLFGRAKCYQDPTLILYVYRGARLVVCNVRFSVFKSPGSRGVEKHCRSLYQQGSVVIVKGVLQLAICTREEKLNKKPKQGLVQDYSQRLIEGNIYRQKLLRLKLSRLRPHRPGWARPMG